MMFLYVKGRAGTQKDFIWGFIRIKKAFKGAGLGGRRGRQALNISHITLLLLLLLLQLLHDNNYMITTPSYYYYDDYYYCYYYFFFTNIISRTTTKSSLQQANFTRV